MLSCLRFHFFILSLHQLHPEKRLYFDGALPNFAFDDFLLSFDVFKPSLHNLFIFEHLGFYLVTLLLDLEHELALGQFGLGLGAFLSSAHGASAFGVEDDVLGLSGRVTGILKVCGPPVTLYLMIRWQLPLPQKLNILSYLLVLF